VAARANSLAPRTAEPLVPYSSDPAPDRRASRAGASPEPRRSTSVPGTVVLRRGSGECPARLARAPGAVSEDIAGGLIPVIWQPNHKGFSASHWQLGTCGACDSLRLDCAKSLRGVQISIPGSDRVRPPWRIGVLRQFLRYSCTSASWCPWAKARDRLAYPDLAARTGPFLCSELTPHDSDHRHSSTRSGAKPSVHHHPLERRAGCRRRGGLACCPASS
jgi:hypothetical protein